jgi:hypothetical protein
MHVKSLVRGFRTMIKKQFKVYDLKRSYHLPINKKREKVKKFFLTKAIFPFLEFTEESYERNEEVFFFLIHNT